MKKLKNYIKYNKKKSLILGAILVILIYFVYSSLSGNGEELYEIYNVQHGDISQEVTETGVVRPGQTVDLSFKIQEKVEKINIEVGDRVKKGEDLIVLDQNELSLNITNSLALLNAARANLDKLISGITLEDRQIYETAVSNAETTLLNKKQSFEDTKSDAESDLAQAHEDMGILLSDAYIDADNAVRNYIDQLFYNPRSANPSLRFTVSNSSLETSVEAQRVSVEERFDNWKDSIDSVDFATVKSNLNSIDSFLNNVALLVNALTTNSGFTQATIDGWKLDVSTARSAINTALTSAINQEQTIKTTEITNLTNINTAQAAVDTAESALKTAQDQLAKAIAPPRSEDISLAQANVDQAEVALAISHEKLSQSVIRAPFEGTITDIDIELGETTAVGSKAVSIDSQNSFQIEVDIYEEDIPWVDVGDPAVVEFVAFPDEIFEGVVMSVNPAEKMVDGVVYYEVKVGIRDEKQGLKNGMTADVTIITDAKTNILVVPRKAVNKRNGKSMVEVLVNEIIEEVEIKTGLQGSNDMFEVVSGLNQGDEVIVR